MVTKFSEDKTTQDSSDNNQPPVDLDMIARGVSLILEGIGEDPTRSGLAGNTEACGRDVCGVDCRHA